MKPATRKLKPLQLNEASGEMKCAETEVQKGKYVECVSLIETHKKRNYFLHVSGLINRGANSNATDSTVAMKPCVFPCESKNHEP
jgi:hypothetical protein